MPDGLTSEIRASERGDVLSAVPDASVSRRSLVLGEYPDGSPISSPMLVLRGRHPGPVLWVQACVHGPETVGPLAIQSFIRSADLDALQGTVICLMLANPVAYRAHSRLTPQDGMNLNRVFPGRAAGSISEQMAHRCFSEAFAHADALIDLHSGGDHLCCCFHAMFRNDGSPAGLLSEKMARAAGTSRLCNLPPHLFTGSAIRAFLAAGKPAVLIECGGGGRITRCDIDNESRAIAGACRALGLLPFDPFDTHVGPAGADLHILASGRGGIFHTDVAPGQEVQAGDQLGWTVDLHGDVVERFASPARAWVAAIRRPYMPVFSGDDIAEMVPIS